MSVTVYGLHTDTQQAVFDDENGEARIEVHELARLHTLADYSTNEHVTRLGRRFHRDTLRAVLRDFENGDLLPLDTCTYENDWYRCEEPAPNGRPARCTRHAKDAA